MTTASGPESPDHADPDGSPRTSRTTHAELSRRQEQLTGVAERVVEIRDAQGIRALAHEARQQVINELYLAQKPFTSTQLSELTGLSPSAMSYHLRSLEKWGVVRRADDGTDARQRPWVAAGTSLRVIGDGEAAAAAQDALRTQIFRALGERVRAQRRRAPEERARYTSLSSGELWLTEEQTADINLWLERAVVELLEQGWVNEPGPGKTRLAFLWSLLPVPEP